MATLTIPQTKFRSRLHDRCASDLSINRSWGSTVEALNVVLNVARSLNPPPGMDSRTLEVICSAVVSELGKNPIITAVTEMRTEEKEKRRIATAAKKGTAGAELTGEVDEDALAALESTIVPADTTKTALRENGKGVHWVPENQEARSSRVVPGTEAAQSVIIDDSGLRTEVTPWQELPSLSDAPMFAPVSAQETPAKEEVAGDKNPNNDAAQVEVKCAEMEDPFAAALGAAMDDAAEEQGQPKAPDVAMGEEVAPADLPQADAEMTDAAPTVLVPATPVDDIEEVPSQPPKTPAPRKPAEGEVEDIEEVPSQPPKTPAPAPIEDDNLVVHATPPGSDAAAAAEPAPSTPILPAANGEDDEPSAELENEAAYVMLMITSAFGWTNAKEKSGAARATLELAWKEVENAIAKIEDHAEETNTFDYSLARPVSDYFLDKVNCSWLIHKLNVINFMNQKESLTAADEIQHSGAPTTLVQEFVSKQGKAREVYLKRVNRAMDEYLLNEPWTKSSSAAAKNADVFAPPKCRLDFLPKQWEERYCDPDKRILWDLNELRIPSGKAAWSTVAEMKAVPEFHELLKKLDDDRYCNTDKRNLGELNEARILSGKAAWETIEEMKADPEFPEMLKKLEEDREDAEDEDFAGEEESDESGEEGEDGIALRDDSDDDSKKARKQSRKKSSATKKPKKAEEKKKKEETEKPTGASKRKNSKPKRVLSLEPVPDVEPARATPTGEQSAPSTAKKTKREGSPLPEMQPKLRFVAESLCDRYEEVREKAQDGKPKHREALAKAAAVAADDSHSKPKGKRTKEDSSTPDSQPTAEETKKKPRKTEEKKDGNAKSSTQLHPKLGASFGTILALLPKKLQSNFTFEHLVEDTANYLSGKELKHKSVERLFKDAEEMSTYHVALVTERMHDLGERKRLQETLTSTSMRPWTHESAKVPNVCSLTGRRIVDKAKLSYVHKDERTTMEDAVRVDACFVPHLVAINFLKVGFKAFDVSGADSNNELQRHASMFVMAMRLLIANTPDRVEK